MADDASPNSALCTCLVVRSPSGFPLEVPGPFALGYARHLLFLELLPKAGELDAHKFWKEARSCRLSGQCEG